MGTQALPPVSVLELAGLWQFAPVVTAFVVLAAGLYLWGVQRVRRRHPARPWPWYRSALFLAGLAVIVIATESGVGSYDDVLFWDHMIQHLLLLMVAPPLLVVGQPATLLLHASRNPVHTWTKKLLRSHVVTWITWPPFSVALYIGVIVGTHLTSFMNLVLVGREPIRWKVSYPSRIFLLFIAMPVDAFTGLVLGSEGSNPFPNLAKGRPSWAPSPLSDVHIGGAVMWVGGAGLMFVLLLTVFFAWTRETRSDGGLGWLEVARRTNFAAQVGANPVGGRPVGARPVGGHPEAGTDPGVPAQATPASANESLDDDDEHLAAYNAYLARLNQQQDH